MESYFDKQAKCLYNKAEEIINTYAMLKANKKGENFDIDIPQDFKNEFFKSTSDPLQNKISLYYFSRIVIKIFASKKCSSLINHGI